MKEEIILELLKVIKNSKKPIIKLFDEETKELEKQNFEDFTYLIRKFSINLGNTLMQESTIFLKGYQDKEIMIREVKNSFKNIEKSLSFILDLYKKVKFGNFSKEIEKEIYLKVVEKILNDYMLWCEKLENAILGIGDSGIVFAPNVEIENKIAKHIIKKDINAKNSTLPFLFGVGFGYLLDDE